ncbi:hypothetical protein FBU30_001132 [Linnemannia zychae]|nr:hypothetical protein FBU30_001132 [Linnemannia zychae]
MTDNSTAISPKAPSPIPPPSYTTTTVPAPTPSQAGNLRWAADSHSHNGSPQQPQQQSTTSSTGSSSSRKHANSVSVAQLEETSSPSAATPPQRKANTASTPSHAGSAQKSKSNNNSKGNENNQANGFNSSPLTFRAYAPQNQFKDVQFTSSPNPSASTSGSSTLHMNHSTPQDLSASTAKKKPRNQGDASAYQDSFQAVDPSDAKSGSRKTTTKKATGSSPPRTGDGGDSQHQQQHQPPQKDFKFVVGGQEKSKTTKPVAFEVLPPFQVKSPSQTQSPSQDTPGDDSTDQEAPDSSPTPDFERNADGKFRCSWPRCGKEFTVASRLSTHFRIHSGKPPYLCGYKDCQKAFHTSSSLSHHRVVHTDQELRPYICRHNRCGATYTQLARLITHQRTTHSGMILFITQDSSTSTSSSQNQSQSASSTNTPNGNTPDDSFASSPSQTPVPSGPDSAGVPASATVENNSTNSRPSTPVGSNDPTRAPTEGSTEDKTKSTTRKDKGGNSRTSVTSAPQTAHPSQRPMVEQQQRSHTASPTSHATPTPFVNNVTSMSTPLRPSSATGSYSDDSFRNANRNDRVPEIRAENGLNSGDIEDENETDEMRQRREAALTMASFKDMIRVEQPQPSQLQHQHQSQPSGHLPPPPSTGYYSPQQQHQQQYSHENSQYSHQGYGPSSQSHPLPSLPAPHNQQQQQQPNHYWSESNNGPREPVTNGPLPSQMSKDVQGAPPNKHYQNHAPLSIYSSSFTGSSPGMARVSLNGSQQSGWNSSNPMDRMLISMGKGHQNGHQEANDDRSGPAQTNRIGSTTYKNSQPRQQVGPHQPWL